MQQTIRWMPVKSSQTIITEKAVRLLIGQKPKAQFPIDKPPYYKEALAVILNAWIEEGWIMVTMEEI